MTFKATTAALLSNLNQCVEIIGQREELLRKKLEKETERRRKAEEMLKTCRDELDKTKKASILGPDLEVKTINFYFIFVSLV